MQHLLTENAARRNVLGAMIALMKHMDCFHRYGCGNLRWQNHSIFQPKLSNCCKPVMGGMLELLCSTCIVR